MEHASIAAFARFSLQLLSLGAPADLLEASVQAQRDETHHARLAFSLASRYRGEDIGPGPLPLEGSLSESSWESIFVGTILEGCIGETRAALEAAEAALGCTDRVVAEVLSQIAHDEANHAALAWRAVAWMLSERPELVEVARDAFARASSEGPSSSGRPRGAASYGVLDSEQLTRAWERARREVIEPCARALLAAHVHSSPLHDKIVRTAAASGPSTRMIRPSGAAGT
jgi:hypothetical protein